MLHLPPIALLALLVKYVVEAVHNQVQLFAMLATIVPWELKIALWLSMYVIWDMSAQNSTWFISFKPNRPPKHEQSPDVSTQGGVQTTTLLPRHAVFESLQTLGGLDTWLNPNAEHKA